MLSGSYCCRQSLARARGGYASASRNVGEEQAIVTIGGGAVELQLPADFSIAEVPVRRELRVVATRFDYRGNLRQVTDGFWICYHLRADSPLGPLDERADVLHPRLKLVTQDLAVIQRTWNTSVGEWPARTISFALQETGTRIDEDSGDTGESAERGWKGMHCGIRTQWGIVELHFVAPAALYPSCTESWEQVVRNLRFRPPRAQPQPDSAQITAAAEILGSWKSTGGRLQLLGSGRVRLQFDRPRLRFIDDQQVEDPVRRESELTGKFLAQEDLLLVTWDDGSKLNYRWRLLGHDLLLSDHQGRISHLRRLIQ